jgi:Ca-activated chloride channel homolog
MSFQWPWMLLLALVAVPLLVARYRALQQRRAGRRAELASLGLVAPGPAASGRRRHVAPVLLLLALTVLLVGLARPEATVAQARREGTVVLAFDVSRSMAATDLSPTRLDAAKAAARSFVERQPTTIRLGVVAFGASGLITQQPTTDRRAVLAAIDRLSPQGGTAVGRGIQTSLSAIAGKPVQLSPQSDGSVEAEGQQDLGFHGSAAVVMLTDGENTAEPDPLAVAQVASSAGVKIYPIGIGSPAGAVLQVDGFQVATHLDEDLLRQIADTTDGKYYAAADEQELAKVYDSIQPTWRVEAKRTEITGLFAAAAALLVMVGAALSFVWFGRVV